MFWRLCAINFRLEDNGRFEAPRKVLDEEIQHLLDENLGDQARKEFTVPLGIIQQAIPV